MKRSCDVCGTEYEAKRASSRYCSGTCRKRAQRGGTARVEPAAVVPIEGAGVPASSGTVAAVTKELEKAGRLDTYLGAAAIELARRIDESTAVMGFAPLVKELRATMDAALAGAKVAADPLDELRARRDRKRNAG